MEQIATESLADIILHNLFITEKLLLVDTRPYISHNEEHIKGASNMYCPPILKRRFAKGGSVHLESMLSADTKSKLLNGYYDQIVLYDDGGNFGENGDLYVVWKCMVHLGVGDLCKVLEGGYTLFRTKYPHMCTKSGSDTKICHNYPTNMLTRSNSTHVEPVEILPHLFIGNATSATSLTDLKQRGITAILNVSSCDNHFITELRYKNITVDDNHSTELSLWFWEAIQFIDEVHAQGGKTLVHCQAGISRSATICLAYVMQHNRLSLDSAFEYVRERRNEISPNASFLRQLLQFEKELQTSDRMSTSSSTSSPCAFFSVSSSFPGCSPLEMSSPFSSPFSSPTALCSPMLSFT